MKLPVCDLCHHRQPSLYCSSDSAFLCSDCDSQVHTANFLVARHVRVPVCISCEDDVLSSSSSSTTRIDSKTTSSRKTKDVLVSWSSRLGVSSSVGGQAFRANRLECPYWALWLGFIKDVDKKRILKRLEEISGVQQSKLVKMMKHRRRQHPHQQQHEEESWAEC